MSKRRRSGGRATAEAFAALGDETRLALVAKLCAGRPRSISQLTEGSGLTRQAVTKHLRVLQASGVLHSRRRGRERLWRVNRGRLAEAQQHLQQISRQWDGALERLQAYVEA